MKRFRWIGLFILLAAMLGSCSSSGCMGSWQGSKMLGNRAPEFRLPNLKGEYIALFKLVQEKPVLLVFWATWCPTCIEEIPTLNKWVDLFPDLHIIGINVQESPKRVEDFVEKRKMRYTILLDQEGTVAEQYGLVGIPATILIAKDGKIIYYGFSLPDHVEELIKP